MIQSLSTMSCRTFSTALLSITVRGTLIVAYNIISITAKECSEYISITAKECSEYISITAKECSEYISITAKECSEYISITAKECSEYISITAKECSEYISITAKECSEYISITAKECSEYISITAKECSEAPPSYDSITEYDVLSDLFHGTAVYHCPGDTHPTQGDAYVNCQNDGTWSELTLQCGGKANTIINILIMMECCEYVHIDVYVEYCP